MRRPRLQAAITGKAGKQRELGPEASHERNVLAITRRIHTKAARLRRLTEEAKQLRAELRADRRELRLVLQRSSSFTFEQLEAGGKCDAVDAVINRQERGPQ
jgi:hypothetical protein